MSDSRTFGGWLQEQRQARGVTQADLAEDLGFSAALLRKLEAGERRASVQIVDLLAAYFRIPADERAAFAAFARPGQAAAGPAAPAADAASSRTPWRGAYLRRTNLPALLAPLIGREREGALAHDLLCQPRTRLLTLTGPPGIGKTRLALHVAAELADPFADGVFFVDLAPVSDPALVVPTVVRTLGLPPAGDRPIERVLLDYVGGRRMLLLLDNFEQVLDAAPAVVQLLQASPWLKVLVTSREALHVQGEHRLPLSPLGLPDQRRLPAVAGLAAYPAVALFVERAQAVDPAFALTAENAADVVAVCLGLAGLPLAIELAAAHTPHLPPSALRDALGSQLTLLTGGPRDLPARQQTLRGAIAWSYDLLADHEQHLFRALGVFMGGFTADAVDGISAGWPAAPVAPSVTLLALADKYLVQDDRPPAPRDPLRFDLLPAVREYALEQLARHGETAETRRRHAAYYLALAEQAELHRHGPQMARWLDRLEREHDNLRAALGWALAADPAAALHLAAATWFFWGIRGYWSEGREYLAAALAGAAALDPATVGHARAQALYGAAILAGRQGDHPAGRPLLEQCLLLARQGGDRHMVAGALRVLGNTAHVQGDFAAARSLYEQSLALSRELGDQPRIALALVELGGLTLMGADYAAAHALFADALTRFQEQGDLRNGALVLGSQGSLAGHQGNFPAARALLEQSLAVLRELDDTAEIVLVNVNLGIVAYAAGDYPAARARFEQSLALIEEEGVTVSTGDILFQLGCVAYAVGDYAAAGVRFQQAQTQAQEQQNPLLTARCLAGLGAVAVGQGRPDGAAHGARLLGAAAAPLRAHGDALPPWARRDHEQWRAAARAALGDAAFAAAFAAGQALPLTEAVALAQRGNNGLIW
jgi:predicted ATPase/transcriptional regulator with XRE-family HTH domain